MGAIPEAVEPPTNTAVTLRGVFSDAELDGLTQRELQEAIERGLLRNGPVDQQRCSDSHNSGSCWREQIR